MLNHIEAEVDESTDFRRRMFARRMEGEERKTFAVPVWKEVDQNAVFQRIPGSPTDDLGDARASNAFIHHRFRICEDEWTAGRNIYRFLAAHELPLVRPAAIRIDELQTAMVLQLRWMAGTTVAPDVAWR